jgi:hypothetical protein
MEPQPPLGKLDPRSEGVKIILAFFGRCDLPRCQWGRFGGEGRDFADGTTQDVRA